MIKFNPVEIEAWITANLVKIVIVIALLLTAYLKGRHDVEQKVAKQQVSLYEKALKLQEREHTVEIKEQSLATERELTNNTEVLSALGALREKLNKKPSNPSCDLTDDELFEFNRLVETTK